MAEWRVDVPRSKRPRKPGHHGMINRKLAMAKRMDRMSDEKLEKLADDLEKEMFRRTLSKRHYEWMSVLQEHEELIEGFTRAQYALGKLRETNEIFDFNILCSSLMLGAMTHRRLGVEETTWLEDIRRAAFETVYAYKLRGENQQIPDGNLKLIGIGLDAAQDLIAYAVKNDPQAMKEVLIKNDPLYTRLHPEEMDDRERFIMGDRYELVKSWKLERNPEFN